MHSGLTKVKTETRLRMCTCSASVGQIAEVIMAEKISFNVNLKRDISQREHDFNTERSD